MKTTMKKLIQIGAFLLDVVSLPFIVVGGAVMKILRKNGIIHFPFARKLMIGMGIWPLFDHYAEPLFNPAHLRNPLKDDRTLPGIDLRANSGVQRTVLRSKTDAMRSERTPIT